MRYGAGPRERGPLMSSYISDLAARAKTAASWMHDAAFPFWAERCQHPDVGFLEVLDLQGQPVLADTSRVRVQARQTYCFALAASLGWNEQRARELVEYGIHTLRAHCKRPDGVYGTLLNHQGGLKDDTALLYDTAFALLGLSTSEHVFESSAVTELCAVASAIETQLSRPDVEQGYSETLPTPSDRNQNPHMHLYEASLAQFEATGDAEALVRARRIEALMTERFIDPAIGGLRERFASDWGAHLDDHFEAGHQYEWVWLIANRARLDGQPVSSAAERLYRKALELTGPDAEVFLEHELTGDLRNGAQRCWGLTEALKAHLVRIEQGDEAAMKRAIETYDRLWDLHVAPAVEGGWIDQYDQAGNQVSKDMPASTGYHIFLAYAELGRVAAKIA